MHIAVAAPNGHENGSQLRNISHRLGRRGHVRRETISMSGNPRPIEVYARLVRELVMERFASVLL